MAFSNVSSNSFVELTLNPVAPKLSANFTKSGLVNLVNPVCPNSIFCFNAINPYSPSTQTTIITGNFKRTAVSNSCTFIKNAPSPHIATIFFSGCTICAASAPGNEKPIEQNPFGIIQVLGK